MRYAKAFIKHIPVIGYIVRFLAALVLLPRTLSRTHNHLVKLHKEIDELHSNSLSANLKIVELNEELIALKDKLPNDKDR